MIIQFDISSDIWSSLGGIEQAVVGGFSTNVMRVDSVHID